MNKKNIEINQSDYPGCKILGDGKINSLSSKATYKFKINEISALKIKITTDAQYKLGTEVNLQIRLGSIIFDAEIKTKGKIVNITDDGYDILFIGLPDADREELNEIIKNTCN